MEGRKPVRVLLHACCGPCLLEPFDAFRSGHEVTVCFANPNIRPIEEYIRRRDALTRHAREAGIVAFEVPWVEGEWETAVAGASNRSDRCRRCYALRLGIVAREAASGGYDAVATTLSVSPFQDPVAIEDEGAAACERAGVLWAGADFRERYGEAVRRSREMGMYRQNYCGCLPSVDEARQAREARRAEGPRRP